MATSQTKKRKEILCSEHLKDETCFFFNTKHHPLVCFHVICFRDMILHQLFSKNSWNESSHNSKSPAPRSPSLDDLELATSVQRWPGGTKKTWIWLEECNCLRLFQHTLGTHPEQPLPTGYKGIPFIVGYGDCPGCVLRVCCNFLGNRNSKKNLHPRKLKTAG